MKIALRTASKLVRFMAAPYVVIGSLAHSANKSNAEAAYFMASAIFSMVLADWIRRISDGIAWPARIPPPLNRMDR